MNPESIPAPAGKSEQPARPTRRVRVRAILAIGLMLVFSVALLRVDFSAFGEYGYLGVFGLMLLGNATVIVPAPAFVTALAAGRTLNPLLVGLISGLGAGLGETTGYIVGRQGRNAVGEHSRLVSITNHVRRYGAWAVFVFAAVPNPLMDVAGMAAGMIRLPFWKYLLACCAGKAVRFTLLALLGHSFGSGGGA